MIVTAPQPQDHLAPGAKLRARGVPVTLADGRTVHLRYGMTALVLIEETFGSIGAVQDLLGKNTGDRPVFGPLVDLLACGLSHEGLNRQLLLEGDLLSPSDLQEYMTAAGSAFAQAFPDAPSGGAQGQAVVIGTLPAPGPIGTTSAQSRSAGPTTTGGA